MATAMLLEWEGLTQEGYDRVLDELGLDENPADGGIFHVAGPMDGGFRVLDIWESQDHFQRFMQERLQAAFERAGLSGEPTVEFYPVHNVWAPDVDRVAEMGRSPVAT